VPEGPLHHFHFAEFLDEPLLGGGLLLLALDAGLFVVLTLFQLREDASLLDLLLEAAQGHIEVVGVVEDNTGHGDITSLNAPENGAAKFAKESDMPSRRRRQAKNPRNLRENAERLAGITLFPTCSPTAPEKEGWFNPEAAVIAGFFGRKEQR
jgi:hypothetical protein